MQHDNVHNKSTDKTAPQNIAGKNEEQAKQKTEPLERDNSVRDQQEGNMHNGELGEGLKKED